MTEFNSIVLAGGQSRRMRREKATIPIDGNPMLLRIVNQLKGKSHKVIVCGAAESIKPGFLTGVQWITDREPNRGPLMGIASGLSVSDREWNFVTGCDFPDIHIPDFFRLLNQMENEDAIVPVFSDSGIQPLNAFYRNRLADVMFSELQMGPLGIQRFLSKIVFRKIVLDGALCPINLNTPEEYAHYVNRLSELSNIPNIM